MNTQTFAEAYCLKHGITSDRFTQVVLARTLYPHARLLAPLLREFNPDHFAADLDLVRGVGQLRRVRDFSHEAAEFAYHPANRGDMRRLLRLRISTKRLKHLMQQTLHGQAAPVRSDPDNEPRLLPPAERQLSALSETSRHHQVS